MSNKNEYQVKKIYDKAVYTVELQRYLPLFYYLMLWKGYPEKKNIRETILIVEHFRNLINNFHKAHLDKLTSISPSINIILLMPRPTKPFIWNKNVANPLKAIAMINVLKKTESLNHHIFVSFYLFLRQKNLLFINNSHLPSFSIFCSV